MYCMYIFRIRDNLTQLRSARRTSLTRRNAVMHFVARLLCRINLRDGAATRRDANEKYQVQTLTKMQFSRARVKCELRKYICSRRAYTRRNVNVYLAIVRRAQWKRHAGGERMRCIFAAE